MRNDEDGKNSNTVQILTDSIFSSRIIGNARHKINYNTL